MKRGAENSFSHTHTRIIDYRKYRRRLATIGSVCMEIRLADGFTNAEYAY